MLKQEAGSVEEWIFLFVNCFVVLVANWRFFSPSYLLHIHVSCIMVKLYRRQCYNKTYVHVLSLFFMSNKTMSLWCFFSCHIFYCITKNLHDAVNCIRHLRKHFRLFSDFYWNCSSDGSSTLYIVGRWEHLMKSFGFQESITWSSLFLFIITPSICIYILKIKMSRNLCARSCL